MEICQWCLFLVYIAVVQTPVGSNGCHSEGLKCRICTSAHMKKSSCDLKKMSCRAVTGILAKPISLVHLIIFSFFYWLLLSLIWPFNCIADPNRKWVMRRLEHDSNGRHKLENFWGFCWGRYLEMELGHSDPNTSLTLETEKRERKRESWGAGRWRCLWFGEREMRDL